MAVPWAKIFENHGIKTVTKTDKDKDAYVLNKGQLAAVQATGRKASEERPAAQFDVTLVLDPRRSVKASYYHAKRKTKGRKPEPRLGTELITSWLTPGDRVVIGNIGDQLFASKVPDEDFSAVDVATAIAQAATPKSREALIEKAKQAKGRPAKRSVVRNDYVRNLAVVAGAIARANRQCEMPGCKCELFQRDDDTLYLEVHHIIPLGEEGEDTLVNAAALCPNCHRRLHYAKNRLRLRSMLKAIFNYEQK